MSSTGGPPGDFSPNSSARINATIGIAAFVVIFGCVAFFVTLDLCLRVLLRRYTGIIPLGGVGQRQAGTGTHVNLLNKGLDQGVIDSLLPAFVYGKEGYVGATTECAVCLSEFEDGERGRLLPKCNHAFHAGCIDMWFQSHATCPICRSPVVDNPDASSTAGAATATATATAAATITISESESSRDNTPASPIQVASSSSLSSEALAELQGSSSHPAAPVVIIIPRMEEDGSSTGAADGLSSARSSFHSVIDVSKEQQPEPKSPVVAATTMERLRSLGRILSRRDLGSTTQLPSPRV